MVNSITEPECPFFIKGKGLNLVCEIATIDFPNAETAREHRGNYCCDTKGYKDCSFYKTMMFYYEGRGIK